MPSPQLIKVSGHQVSDPDFLSGFATAIASQSQPTIVVHGGGKEISELQERTGIVPQYVDGVRVTDLQSLHLVEMVLCGAVNKRIVHHFVDAGLDALGISGVDRSLIRARRMVHESVDMMFTGEPVSVRDDLLHDWLEAGITPVIAPICIGDGARFNVNADHIAGAVATAVNAERLVFVSNVAGVKADDAVLPMLDAAQTQALIADGTISGGMIPKVQTALQALAQGVQRVVITDLDGLRTGGGTIFHSENIVK